MQGSKSAFLIDFYSNCKKNGFCVFLMTHKLDTRYGVNVVASKLGQKEYAFFLNNFTNIFLLFLNLHRHNLRITYILLDEVQFLTKQHIDQLIKIVNLFPVFIICFGLRTDFLKRPFKGSSYLLTMTDYSNKIMSYCFCEKIAAFNLRFDKKKCKIKKYGKKIVIGGSELYMQVCRQHSLLF